MKKKLISIVLTLSLLLVACNKETETKNSIDDSKNSDVTSSVETDVKNESEDLTENNSEITNPEENIDVSSLIDSMKTEFLTSNNYGEVRDFNIEIEENIISVLITVEEGTTVGTSEGLCSKIENKLNSLFLEENTDLNKYIVNYKVVEDSTNNILLTK